MIVIIQNTKKERENRIDNNLSFSLGGLVSMGNECGKLYLHWSVHTLK
jgi:hypothetical protein